MAMKEIDVVKLSWRRVIALFTRDLIDRDIDKELHLHVDLLAKEYKRAGMSPEDARWAALRRFGNVLQGRPRYMAASYQRAADEAQALNPQVHAHVASVIVRSS